MVNPGRTVFLSYRREVSWTFAHAVRGDLVRHHFDVFLDSQSIDSGEFERVILREIELRPHFVVLLEPRSLDRITEKGDWLRREIAHALARRRNVVPLLANGVRIPPPADLPADVARLSSFNAVSVPHDYFAEAMHKLRGRFLQSAVAAGVPGIGDAYLEGAIVPAPKREPPQISARTYLGANVVIWSAIAGASVYEVQRARFSTFWRAVDVYQGQARRFDDAPTSPVGWHYRVRACYPDEQCGPWSDPSRAS